VHAQDRRLRSVVLVDEELVVAIVARSLERQAPRVRGAVGGEGAAERSARRRFLPVDVAARADAEHPVIPRIVLRGLLAPFGLREGHAEPIRDRRLDGVADEADAEALGEPGATLVGGGGLRRVVDERLVLPLKAADADGLHRELDAAAAR